MTRRAAETSYLEALIAGSPGLLRDWMRSAFADNPTAYSVLDTVFLRSRAEGGIRPLLGATSAFGP